MARPNPRLAAGVGLLTAFLAVAGPGAAVATGHPGDRGDRGNNSERGGRGDRGDDRGYGGHRPQHGNKPGYGKGEDRPGSGHRPGFDNGGTSDGATKPDDDSVAQDGEDGEDIVPLEPGTSRVGAQRLAPSDDSDADAGASDDDDDSGIDTDTGSDAGTGGGASSGGGSNRAGSSAPAFSPPKVTVGNGRVPAAERDSEPSGGVSAPDPAPAAPAPAPPPAPPVQTSPPASSVPSWTDLLAVPPVVPTQLSVAPTADSVDPLWGVAGLLLIPAAGAALGYRQARAAQAAERLNRT